MTALDASNISRWSFLGSQRAFLPSKSSVEELRAYGAGWRSGKTTALCRAAVLLSYFVPDNLGFIGRASGKDMENTLYETFFNQVCPASLILDQKKLGQTGRMVTLRSVDPLHPSRIYMDYIIDREAGKAHFAGGDWGWFGVSQAEEISRDDFNKLLGRLSRRVPRNYGLLEFNLQGHNWIYEEFFAGGDHSFSSSDTAMFKMVRGNNRIGVVARSEENMVSRGGFVRDEYFARLRETMPPEWIARQLDSSFDDFSGKIYKGYSLSSVHHIREFRIPDHWGWLVSIDPGGSDPTCVGVFRVDTSGNLICVDEFYRPNVNPYSIIEWMRSHVPTREARYVIDYENRLFTIQLQDEFGILCEPAIKDVYAGCQQAASYFWPTPKTPLPSWYAETQPDEFVERFKDSGSPRIFFVKGKCPSIARSCDNYVWDEKNPERPKPGDDHGGDCVRYACMSRPRPAARSAAEEILWQERNDPLRHLLPDRASYESAKNVERRLEQARRRQNATDDDLSSDGLYLPFDPGEVTTIDEFM